MKLNAIAAWFEHHSSKVILGALVIIMLVLSGLVIEAGKLIDIREAGSHGQTTDDSILRPPEGYFQAQESVINDDVHWPKTMEEIDALFSMIESKTAALNVVQKMALGQEVERLEWSLNALRFLAAQGRSQLDRDDWQDLLDRAPKGASAKLINAVKSAEPSSERALTDAIAGAEKLLITVAVSADQLSETWNRLDSLSRAVPKTLIEKFNEAKKNLKSALVQAEIRETCEDVGRQLNLLSKLDVPDKNASHTNRLHRRFPSGLHFHALVEYPLDQLRLVKHHAKNAVADGWRFYRLGSDRQFSDKGELARRCSMRWR